MTQRAHMNPELLIWARETMNLSLGDAAQKLQVSEERLRTWEEGSAKPTIKQLRTASRVYKRPLAAFYLAKRPDDFRIPHDFRTVPDEMPISPEFCGQFREAVFRRRVAIACAGIDVESRHQNIVGSVNTEVEVEEAAVTARELLAVPLQVQLSWMGTNAALNGWIAAVERLGVLVFHFSHVSVDEVRGFAICDTPFPVIALNGSDAPAARVFTLIHEFIHLLIGEGGVSDLKAVRPVVTQEQRVERFCNRVAGLCLVPCEPLRQWLGRNGDVSVEEQLTLLARQYSVSRAVILHRLWSERRITEDYFWDTIGHLSSPPPARESSGRPQVPQMTLRAGGPLYTSVVLNAYDREVITSADLSEYLGARLKHVPEVRRILRRRLETAGASA